MILILVMHAAHGLGGVDLNLLRVLDALLRERHLTRAGARLGLSQSATSHALARLRDLFDDPLFVRTPRGLVATPRAEELEEPLAQAMEALGRCLEESTPFEPRRSRRTFTVATADYGSFVLIPPLLEAVTREAPDVDLWLKTVAEDPFDQLARGDADVVIVPSREEEAPSGIRSRALYDERFVCLVRRDHPVVGQTLDLDTWTSLRHVFIAPRGTPGGVVDTALAAMGKTRRVALAVPHFLMAPHIVAESDLVLTLGEHVAQAFVRILPVRIVEAPVKLPTFNLRMFWHERQHRVPAQQWFRALMLRANGLGGASSPSPEKRRKAPVTSPPRPAKGGEVVGAPTIAGSP